MREPSAVKCQKRAAARARRASGEVDDAEDGREGGAVMPRGDFDRRGGVLTRGSAPGAAGEVPRAFADASASNHKTSGTPGALSRAQLSLDDFAAPERAPCVRGCGEVVRETKVSPAGTWYHSGPVGRCRA